MEIKQAIIMDCSEPLSKALVKLDETPAIVITRGGKYYGIIDHSSVSSGIRNPKKTKCENAIVKPPTMVESTGVIERISAFLLGHFKALPVLDDNGIPIGITTRVELLQDMKKENLMPNGPVTELMNSPVYTIPEDENIANLKNVFREKNARRMVVTGEGNPIGLVSTFDIGMWSSRPNFSGGRMDPHSEKRDIDGMPIKSFVRPDITTMNGQKTISDAATVMIKKQVSSVIITDGKKAVGVLSAFDIFKKVQDMIQEKTVITISGLSEDQKPMYNDIKDTIGKVIEKFNSSFDIKNVSIHTKEGKSNVMVNIYFDTNEGYITLKGERTTLKETVDELAEELDKVLRNRKDLRLKRG
ncbi:CBS domain-containing protein [Candidatus Micrarchaeota archaeon]|nr:CBS domain-containing protein [Candidatus Micrarchaeota archaeon]